MKGYNIAAFQIEIYQMKMDFDLNLNGNATIAQSFLTPRKHGLPQKPETKLYFSNIRNLNQSHLSQCSPIDSLVPISLKSH